MSTSETGIITFMVCLYAAAIICHFAHEIEKGYKWFLSHLRKEINDRMHMLR